MLTVPQPVGVPSLGYSTDYLQQTFYVLCSNDKFWPFPEVQHRALNTHSGCLFNATKLFQFSQHGQGPLELAIKVCFVTVQLFQLMSLKPLSQGLRLDDSMVLRPFLDLSR